MNIDEEMTSVESSKGDSAEMSVDEMPSADLECPAITNLSQRLRWASPKSEIEEALEAPIDQDQDMDITSTEHSVHDAEHPVRRRWGSDAASADLQAGGFLTDRAAEWMVPVSAVIDGCVIQPILSQHKSIY